MAKASKRSKIKTSEKKDGGDKRARSQLKTSEPLKSNTPDDIQRQEAARDLEIGDRESYLRLRQALDSFNARAIYYYASGADTDDRTARQVKVKRYVDSFLKEDLAAKTTDSDCPPGTRECPDGDCVPSNLPCIH